MYAVSPRFVEATRSPHEVATTLSVETVDGTVTPLLFGGGTVTLSSGTGPRYQADIDVSSIDKSAAGATDPIPETAYGEGYYGAGSYGGDGAPGSSGRIVDAIPTWPLISAEGSLFRLNHGIKYGSASEFVPLGVLENTTVPGDLFASTYPVRLVDRWASLDECDFLEPYQPPVTTRAQIIATTVQSALPFVAVEDRSTDGGGTNPGTAVWDKSRTQMVRDLSRDGRLECYFDGQGTFVIRDEPALQQMPPVGTPAFVLTTGSVGTIMPGASRERVMTPRFNTVVVRPTNEQPWTQQVVRISDPSNPRHRDHIGDRPYFMEAPSAMSAGSALEAGSAMLQRLVKLATLRKVVALSNSALEPGDIGAFNHVATPVDEGIDENVMIRTVKFDLTVGLMELSLTSAGLVALESV